VFGRLLPTLSEPCHARPRYPVALGVADLAGGPGEGALVPA